MASVGKIESFDPNHETFPRYVQRVRNFFAANGIDADKKKYVFLNSLGRKHYNLLANLLSPEVPEDKSLDELVDKLTKHFQLTSSVISERYNFHCRCQEPHESIADFVVGLKKLIIRCDYAEAVQKVLLRDRFVCGLADEATRKRLLTEDSKIDFERTVEIAITVEKASTHAKSMKPSEKQPGGVHTVKGKQLARSSPTCHRCGGPHLAPLSMRSVELVARQATLLKYAVVKAKRNIIQVLEDFVKSKIETPLLTLLI